MKVKILFILMGSILFLQSCAPSQIIKMKAVGSLDQKIGYDGTIVSQKKHLVSLTPYIKLDDTITNLGVAKDKIKFFLTVQNCGEESISIGYDNILVIFEGNRKDWISNKIIIQSSDDFMNDFEKEYNEKELKYIYSTLYEIYHLSLLNIGVMDKLEELKYDIEEMRLQNAVLREILPGIVMKPQTIMAGNSYSAIVVCDTRNLDPKIEGKFRIAVLVDGEEHRFTFNRNLNNKKQ